MVAGKAFTIYIELPRGGDDVKLIQEKNPQD